MTFRFISLPALALLAALLGGCTTPGQTYAGKHPELPAAQRQILTTGLVPAGDAVAGMTREQIRLAMGGEPATYDKVGAEDVWVYAHKKIIPRDPGDDDARTPNSTIDSEHSFTDTSDFTARLDLVVKTTIFFQGDRATHAQITEEHQ